MCHHFILTSLQHSCIQPYSFLFFGAEQQIGAWFTLLQLLGHRVPSAVVACIRHHWKSLHKHDLKTGIQLSDRKSCGSGSTRLRHSHHRRPLEGTMSRQKMMLLLSQCQFAILHIKLPMRGKTKILQLVWGRQ